MKYKMYMGDVEWQKLKTALALKVLSSIFRKIVSEKMKYCAGKPGEGAAKLRLIAEEHMPTAVSRAAKPFILTLDNDGGICYLTLSLSR